MTDSGALAGLAADPAKGNRDRNSSWEIRIAFLLAVFVFALCSLFARVIPRGEPPDEVAHLTYVHEVAVEGRVLPDYAGSRLMGKGRLNYLEHPPLYYTLTGLIGRIFDWDPYEEVVPFRLISAAMIALGVFFWALAGFNFRIPAEWVATSVAATCCIPMFIYAGGSVNNDSLAYLGVALFFCGMTRFFDSVVYACLAACGVLVVLLTKATAGVFVVAFLMFWGVLRVRVRMSRDEYRRFAIWSAAILIPCLVYYVPTFMHYGTLFPHPRDLYPPDPPNSPLSFPGYVAVFGRTMLERLPVVGSHLSIYAVNGLFNIFFWVMLATAATTWMLGLRTGKGELNRLLMAFAMAFGATLLTHMVLMWREYLVIGKLTAGMQPRYYAYLLPGLFMLGPVGSFKNGRLAKSLVLLIQLMAAVLLATVPSSVLLTRALMDRPISDFF